MYNEEDVVLLALMQEKPQEGIKVAINRYAGFVYTIIHNQLLYYSIEDVEECVNDTFLELYNLKDRIDLNIGSIKSLLCTIAKRKAINLYNINNKHRACIVNTLSYYDNENLSDYYSIEDNYIEFESRRDFINIINNLGKPDSEIIVRKYYFLQSSKQIAKDLDLSVNAVDLRVFRALKKLKKYIIGGIANEKKDF